MQQSELLFPDLGQCIKDFLGSKKAVTKNFKTSSIVRSSFLILNVGLQVNIVHD